MVPVKATVLARISGASAIVSQVLAGGTLIAAIVRSPWFSWTENELSILGVEGSTTGLVRCGFVVAGLLNVLFVLGLGRTLPQNRLTRSGVLFLVLGSIALALIGIFPSGIDLPHDAASVGFFVLISLGLLVVGAAAAVTVRLGWALSTLGAGVLMSVLQVVSWPWEGGAIPQILAVVPWSVWTVVNGSLLLRRTAPVRGE